ncbi:MAG: histidine phosphatase family protein [Candidatus Nanoarchaeia archaeon]|nr:histidine phosphatase family protein [Candidatus Nanoarchaeia archaeon]
MKEIYLMRHAETEENEKEIYIGQQDGNLSKSGLKQAQSKKLPDYDVIICSDLKRAKQTAEIINKNNKPVIFTSLLRERSIGDWEGIKKQEFKEKWKSKNEKDCEFKPGNGESYIDVLERFKKTVSLAEKTEHNRIFMITHGRLIKIALNHSEKKPICLDREIKNCEIRRFK